MSVRLLLLILVSISLSASAQISFKYGMSGSLAHEIASAQKSWVEIMCKLFMQPYILIGFACYGIGAIMWLFVLTKLDVSVAYPFVGLGFIVTMLLGAVLLGEAVGILRITGTALVIAGVILVSKS